MGWCHDDGSHEGYLVALVFDDSGTFLGPGGYPRAEGGTDASAVGAMAGSGRMRELGARRDCEANASIAVRCVKAACECGWRSALLRAPEGTEWAPSTVFTAGWFEDAARALWVEHADSCGKVPDGGLIVARPRGAL